jgi:hypothetical protein
MPLSEVKPEYKDKKIAFGKHYTAISSREDIDDIAIAALESNDPSLLKLFKKLPDLSQLKKVKTEAALNRAGLKK